MDKLNMNHLLAREDKAEEIKRILHDFEKQKHNVLLKKGIYVYGDPGTGKTQFVMEILQSLDYDIVKYDAGDIRNKAIIENITKHNMSDTNVMSSFHKKAKKIAIIMDEIDGMNNGDKGGINTLIKLIRPKKTKKQKLEKVAVNPIVCIGNHQVDKKIQELMKVCNTVELEAPNATQVGEIVHRVLPDLEPALRNNIVQFVQGDLRKLNNAFAIYQTNPEMFDTRRRERERDQGSHDAAAIPIPITTDATSSSSALSVEQPAASAAGIEQFFQQKSFSDNTRKITQKLMNQCFTFDQHNTIMNETDRTSVGLLWHENIIDVIDKYKKQQSIPFYLQQLDNICFADYIDRITFQKQIWQFNEMSSLIKTFQNSKHYHHTFRDKPTYNPTEVRFTKVLTKYATEYSNFQFIQKLCQQLGMDKKDLFGFFIELKSTYTDNEIIALLEHYELGKLDVNRMYRYLEKYTKENAVGIADRELDCDDDNDFAAPEELL